MLTTIDRDLEDIELAGRVQAQDEDAFEALYERYQAPLLRHLCSLVRSQPAAQDLLQETFLRMWTHAEQWSGQGSFKAWLYRIATNLAFNHLRTLRRHPADPLPCDDEGAWDEWSEEETAAPGWLVDTSTLGPQAALEEAEKGAQVRQAIDMLPEEKREVFRLVHEMELSIRDAAGRLGIPEGTVKSRLHYAQKQLTQAWRNLDTDQENSI
jgi:RNA polymerase sigma-70 factor (ECF subfamily)